jgi:hypothetical protein
MRGISDKCFAQPPKARFRRLALIAHIAAAKYAWQSTLYRQTQILGGHGVVVDRQTLARWMGSAAWSGASTICNLKTLHGFERLFCDETPMPVLDLGRGRTKICQFRAHATDDRAWKDPAPPAVAYVFAGGKRRSENGRLKRGAYAPRSARERVRRRQCPCGSPPGSSAPSSSRNGSRDPCARLRTAATRPHRTGPAAP